MRGEDIQNLPCALREGWMFVLLVFRLLPPVSRPPEVDMRPSISAGEFSQPLNRLR